MVVRDRARGFDELTISAVESAIVPSQSKTRSRAATSRVSGIGHPRPAHRGARRTPRGPAATAIRLPSRARPADARTVAGAREEHALEPVLRERAVPRSRRTCRRRRAGSRGASGARGSGASDRFSAPRRGARAGHPPATCGPAGTRCARQTARRHAHATVAIAHDARLQRQLDVADGIAPPLPRTRTR